MSVKGEVVVVAGIALAVIYLANQAASAAGKAVTDAKDAALQLAQDAWEAAQHAGAQVIEATVETVTPQGAGLYDPRPPKNGKPKTEYTPGDIMDYNIF